MHHAGVPVHELQVLAGHANITTTQRDMNARVNSLPESMRRARECRADRSAEAKLESVQVGSGNGGEGQNRTVDTTIFSLLPRLLQAFLLDCTRSLIA